MTIEDRYDLIDRIANLLSYEASIQDLRYAYTELQVQFLDTMTNKQILERAEELGLRDI